MQHDLILKLKKMGTNYYIVRKVDEESISRLNQSLQEGKIYQSEEIVDEIKSDMVVHIGKSSYGWEFLFNYNNFKYYQPTRSSISDFLEKNKDCFFNEYGEKVDITEFWDMVDKKIGQFNNERYYMEHENRNLYFRDMDIFKDELEKYKPRYYEFYNDGLRFSTSCDFC